MLANDILDIASQILTLVPYGKCHSAYHRMTCLWSVFGLFGAFRYYLKIAVGLANSEKAGAVLGDAAVYTHRRTKDSSCYWAVNRENAPPSWRSSKDELLSRMRSTASGDDTNESESTWLKPIFIAIGHTRCPFDWLDSQCALEFGYLVACVVLSVGAALFFSAVDLLLALFSLFCSLFLPAEYLVSPIQKFDRADVNNAFIQVALYVFLGILLPTITEKFNAPATVPMSQLYNDSRLSKSGFILQNGDLVMANSSRNEAHIVWQTPKTENSKASGDKWWNRGLGCCPPYCCLQ